MPMLWGELICSLIPDVQCQLVFVAIFICHFHLFSLIQNTVSLRIVLTILHSTLYPGVDYRSLANVIISQENDLSGL